MKLHLFVHCHFHSQSLSTDDMRSKMLYTKVNNSIIVKECIRSLTRIHVTYSQLCAIICASGNFKYI